MKTFETEQEIIETVGQAYLETAEEDLTEEYKALARYNENRFEDIPVNVEFVDEDPYKSAEELFEAIEERDELKIYSGGSSPEGMTDKQNLKGRAVHDYFGHYKNQCGFSLEGEFTKWFNQKSEVPEESEALYFSEVVGQTALVHYLDGGFEDPDFNQRSVILDEDIRDGVVDYFLGD